MNATPDRWAAGSTYEEFMGRWSRRLARSFVQWLDPRPGLDWLDVGCGTGAMVQAICAHAGPASVMGCDPAEAFIGFAQRGAGDPRATFRVAGVGALPGRPGGYGEVTSLLALNFFPDPESAVRELRGLAARGGRISACVWDYGEGMAFLRRFWDAAGALDAGARELDEGRRFPLCRPSALESLFAAAGLGDIRSAALEVATRFADFEDYWRPFLGGTGPAPSYVAALGPEQRAALARELERTLPREEDGSIALTARAWAVCGTVEADGSTLPTGDIST